MAGRLEGKVAIVTGAGSNIGRGVARRFAREGARVGVADVNLAGAEETVAMIAADGGEARAFGVDVSVEQQIAEMFETVVQAWGALNVLHNNAVFRTFSPRGSHPLLDFDADNWRREFDVNIIGVAFGCKLAIPHMIRGGGGSILNTSSVNSLVGDMHRPQYGMAKAAINNLTMTVAVLHGRQGIRCNAIAPGNIPRKGAEAHPYAKLDSPYAVADRSQITPKRGTPDDIASLALFLASDESAFITGRVIPCDGGMVGVTHFDYASLNPLPGQDAAAELPWARGV
ncbi:MAG: SDR family oxidoreductase [Caulobacteraceae bacterium]|nr:SDR family oxidoreductase [Caulobacteraceae bacterium]